MNPTKITVIGLNAGARAPVQDALRLAFPDAAVTEVPGLNVLPGDGASDPNLLVLVEPDESTAARASLAVDAGGFPRWAVVILGPGGSDLADSVPPEEWNAASLARTFRSAVLQHDLLRENLRLRGDLKTVARRISHDLRTPAGCIHTSSDLLDELSLGKSAAITNLADIFRQSSTEISQLVDRVSFVLRVTMDFAASEPVDMGAIVAAALQQLAPEIRAGSVTVIQPDAWPEVDGVAASLQVIWWNLIHNAIQHAGPAVQVRLGWRKEDGGGKFFVEDRGPGAPPSREPVLFSPFEQLHSVRSPGLGLSIVERLVRLQGGRCGYEKLTAGGARFFFTLP